MKRCVVHNEEFSVGMPVVTSVEGRTIFFTYMFFFFFI